MLTEVPKQDHASIHEGLYPQQQSFGNPPNVYYPQPAPPRPPQLRHQASFPISAASDAAQQPHFDQAKNPHELEQKRRKQMESRAAALQVTQWRRKNMRLQRRSQRQSLYNSEGQEHSSESRLQGYQRVQQQDPEAVPSDAQHMQDPLPAPQVTDSQPEPFCSLLPLSSESMLTQGFDPHSGPTEFDIEEYTSRQRPEQQQRAWAGGSHPRRRQTSSHLSAGGNLQPSRNTHWQLQQHHQHHHLGEPETQLQPRVQLPLPSFHPIWYGQDPLGTRLAHTAHEHNPHQLNPHFPLTR